MSAPQGVSRASKTLASGRTTSGMFWRGETIGQKLTLGFLAILAIMAISGAIAFWGLRGVGSDVTVMQNSALQAMEAAHLQLLAETTLLPARDYLLTGDPTAEGRFAVLATSLDASLARLGSGQVSVTGEMAGMDMGAEASPVAEAPPEAPIILLPEEDLSQLGEFTRLWAGLRSGVEGILAVRNPIGNSDALEMLKDLESISAQMSLVAESLHLGGMKTARLSRESANGVILNTSVALLIGVALAVAVVAVLATLIGRSISQPVRQLTKVATDISMGELDTAVDVRHKGEVGELARAIERMRTSLKMMIDRLVEEEEDLRSWATGLVDRELRRKVRSGHIRLGGQRYEVGRDLDGQFVYIKFDYEMREILVTPTSGAPRRLPLRA